ncbi:hypothetical protein BACCIP111895_01617 [Neobacillus rhizosphaerae]|uniref:Sugar isomerase n=1 Tax=Neobacillus rhizosphaerae TaxID=2880965 RepID=A0ABN8KQ77_9BACI|nr:DUF3231 family protein [Neobacillus rhizosphaerae]CAH2714454.1 hypothetical protein BACCIP111895_01617 [Neobacillus rhizosphaerae]
MGGHSIRLTSSEIGGLWAAYLQENMAVCLLTYFLHHNQDEQIKGILQKAYEISKGHVAQITSIFKDEGIPIPDGFSEKDLNLTAPPLFYDMFGLSFVYSMSRMGMVNTSFITVNTARKDVMDFFVTMLQQTTMLYQQATTLMLEKGVYDRPPLIPYPDQVEYVEKPSYISGFWKKRPLNVAEITEVFFNTERNYFSILLCMGLLQVVKDKEIHDYIAEGKKISEKQINTFNDILMREELLGNVCVSLDVTDSTVSPFSNRLIVTLFHSLNSIDVTLIGHALSLSMRTDLAVYYEKYILEILLYSAKGFEMMVERGWMLKPPHAPDRRKLQN